jgi:hypothetical protein
VYDKPVRLAMSSLFAAPRPLERPYNRREQHHDKSEDDRERRADSDEVAESIATSAVDEQIAVVPDRRDESGH